MLIDVVICNFVLLNLNKKVEGTGSNFSWLGVGEEAKGINLFSNMHLSNAV